MKGGVFVLLVNISEYPRYEAKKDAHTERSMVTNMDNALVVKEQSALHHRCALDDGPNGSLQKLLQQLQSQAT
jgi:hypothetical protein